MAAVIALEQITTVLSPTAKRYSFMPSNAALDTVEYCLGLDRGGISQYKDSKLLVTTLQEDMISLLKAARWALLPAREILEKIKTLYTDNHAKGTYNLTTFTQAIPESEYEYTFLCLSPPDDCQWRVDNVAYSFPLQNFPRVRTTIHPCFLFTSLMKFMARGPADQSHLKCMEGMVRLCDEINLLRIRPVYVSWLGATITGRDFPNRITPVARRDPPHFLPPVSLPVPASKKPSARRVTIKSPPKPTGKRTGASTKKALLKAPSTSKARVPRKTMAKKRKASQSSLSSVDEEAPVKRRSPRFNKE